MFGPPLNVNLKKILDATLEFRVNQSINLIDFFRLLGIDEAKPVIEQSTVDDVTIWDALAIALAQDCLTLHKHYSFGLAQSCLSIIVRAQDMPSYLQDLVQEDDLEEILYSNVTIPAIEKLMPFVVYDEKDALAQANRMVTELAANLDQLTREFHYEIIKQYTTETGALVGGVATLLQCEEGTIDNIILLVLKHVLHFQGLPMPRASSLLRLMPVAIIGALCWRPTDADTFTTFVDEFIDELRSHGQWDLEAGVGAVPLKWASDGRAAIYELNLDNAYVDAIHQLTYSLEFEHKHVDDEDDSVSGEPMKDDGDFDGSIGHWADASDDDAKKVGDGRDWSYHEPAMGDGDFEGPIGHWADAHDGAMAQMQNFAQGSHDAAGDDGDFGGPIGHWADATDDNSKQAVTDFTTTGYHSGTLWNELTLKKDDAWNSYVEEPLTTNEEEVSGDWNNNAATTALKTWDYDGTGHNAAWNDHTDIRDVAWEGAITPDDSVWLTTANEQPHNWVAAPIFSWDDHVAVAEEDDDVEAFPPFDHQHKDNWADWNEPDAKDNQDDTNVQPSFWTDDANASSPAAASVNWSEDTVRGTEWNPRKDTFSAMLTYQVNDFDNTYHDNEFDTIKHAHWNDVPALQNMYVRAY